MTKQKSSNENLDDILSKSSGLMAKRGFHGTSMRDLALATGRSLSGLYHYFHSKEDLLYLINIHGFTRLEASWRKIEAQFETPQEKLYGFIYCHIHYFTHNADEMRVMNWGTLPLTLERARTIKDLKEAHMLACRKILDQLYREQAGNSLDETKLDRQTFLLFGMMNWMFGWYSPNKHGSLRDLATDIFHTFVNGFLSQQKRIAENEPAAFRLPRKWIGTET